MLPTRVGNTTVWQCKRPFVPQERLVQKLRGQKGVGIQEHEIILVGRSCARVSGSRDLVHRFEDHTRTELAGNAGRLIGRIVVNHHNFARCHHRDLEAMRDILRVCTSAGGARAKAVIAWNPATGEVRSGQVQAPPGFGYWLLKFDGVSGNRDKELDDSQGYGRIEYAYHLMALEAGVEMRQCRLFQEHGRSHFMTKRFDRSDDGEKVFMQSFCALGHHDFNQAGAYSYEQALQLTQELGLEVGQREQLFRRALFNILARSQDDHTKNIAFLMDKSGVWRLAPAFDVIYSYNPQGSWTSQHQMSLNGKRDGFTLADLRVVANRFRLFRGKRLDALLQHVDGAVGKWPEFADQAGVPAKRVEEISRNIRRLGQLRTS